jgi:hypothetical protein
VDFGEQPWRVLLHCLPKTKIHITLTLIHAILTDEVTAIDTMYRGSASMITDATSI